MEIPTNKLILTVCENLFLQQTKINGKHSLCRLITIAYELFVDFD